jgi:hypothetical protein
VADHPGRPLTVATWNNKEQNLKEQNLKEHLNNKTTKGKYEQSDRESGGRCGNNCDMPSPGPRISA